MKYYIVNAEGKEIAFDVSTKETNRTAVVGRALFTHSTEGVNVSRALDIFHAYSNEEDSGKVISDTVGVVTKVMTAVGATVSKGDNLLLLTLQDRPTYIKSSVDGIVKAVHVEASMKVVPGLLMVEIDD